MLLGKWIQFVSPKIHYLLLNMLNIILNSLNKGKLLWQKHLMRFLKILYFYDTIFVEQIHNELLTKLQELETVKR